MARPPRCRRIRCYPEYWSFAPREAAAPGTILLTLDEYECIRLIDKEALTQEQCAEQMGVARSTVTNIYESARKKLASVLVEGYTLSSAADTINWQTRERITFLRKENMR